MRVYAAKAYEPEMAQIQRLCGLLDADRRKKILALRNKMEQQRSILAGLLLRHAFLQSGYGAGEWQRAEIKTGAYGKPHIRGYQDFHYSISHSGAWAVCASDTRPVGADIQEMKPFRLQVAKRFYDQEEYNRLLVLGESDAYRQAKEFYSMWTAKESAVKLSGRGIGAGISRYVTAADYNAVHDAEHGKEIGIKLYDALPGYIICVCSEAGAFPGELEVIDIVEEEN